MPSGLSDPSRSAASAALSDPELRRILSSLVRRKVPSADADDLVQATLADALAAPRIPEDPTELRRWVFGIARNKIADFYRLGRREIPHEPPALDAPAGEQVPATGEPHSARDLLRWAEEALPENDAAQQTFDWMLREGQGEKLEAIAAEAKLPAPQVRKRVSRLRQHLKEKWVLELSAVAALGLAIWLGLRVLRPEPLDVGPDRMAGPTEAQRATELRKAAMESCAARDFRNCLELLDRAKGLDAAGDANEDVRKAREMALEALQSESRPAGPAPGPDTKFAPSKDSITPPTNPPAKTGPKTPSNVVGPKAPAPPSSPNLPTPPKGKKANVGLMDSKDFDAKNATPSYPVQQATKPSPVQQSGLSEKQKSEGVRAPAGKAVGAK